MFQSTPPRGGRRIPLREAALWLLFQSTPPRGGRRVSDHMIHDVFVQFQSTPPRGGRHRAATRRDPRQTVSIHAPARGATALDVYARPDPAEFQSTPPRGGRRWRWIISDTIPQCFNPRPRAGGDRLCRRLVLPHQGFNPRPRAGGDHESYRCRIRYASVSIHAPARGATADNRTSEVGLNYSFNPRPRAGGDDRRAVPRRGCKRFNPRPRAGGDTIQRTWA